MINGAIQYATDFVDDRLNDVEYEVNQLKEGNFQRASDAILNPSNAFVAMNPMIAPVNASIVAQQEAEGKALGALGTKVEEATGIPAGITEFGAGLLVPGPGEVQAIGRAVKPVVNKGAVRLLQSLPAEPAQALTIKNPDFLAKGVTQGIASGSDFGPAMTKWRNRRMELREQMRNPKGLTAKRRASNAAASKEVAYNDVSTGPNTDPLDVEAYGRKNYKVKGMEQHHLFPKKESYEFVEKMLKVGDEDDVLNLFLYAEELDAVMGGRLSNILNMNIPPHKQLHNNRIKDGRQLKGVKLFNKVDQAKNADEVMEMFDKYIINNIQPSKAEAKQLQKAFEQAKNKMNTFNSLTEAQRRRL